LKIAGSQDPDTAKYSCTNFTHIVPHKGYAIIQGGDVGSPSAVQINSSITPNLPAWIKIKKVGGPDEWSKFDLSKTTSVPGTPLTIHSDQKAYQNGLLSDRYVPELMRADKQYAIEFLKAVSGR
jgi:hypothetical protein